MCAAVIRAFPDAGHDPLPDFLVPRGTFGACARGDVVAHVPAIPIPADRTCSPSPTPPFPTTTMTSIGNRLVANVAAADGKTAASMLLNFCSSTGIVVTNKLVMDRCEFRFATTLTFFHFVATYVLLLVAAAVGVFEKKALPLKETAKLAAGSMGFVVLTNLSLQYNSVGFYQVMKVMTTPTVVVIEALAYAKVLEAPLRLALVPVCLGVIFTAATDFRLNAVGTAFAVAGVLVTSFYQIGAGTLQRSLDCSALQLQLYTAPMSALFIMPFVPLFDNWRPSSPASIWQYEFDQTNMLLIGLTGVLAFLVNVSIFLVIGRSSAVSYNTLGHFKTCFILVSVREPASSEVFWRGGWRGAGRLLRLAWEGSVLPGVAPQVLFCLVAYGGCIAVHTCDTVTVATRWLTFSLAVCSTLLPARLLPSDDLVSAAAPCVPPSSPSSRICLTGLCSVPPSARRAQRGGHPHDDGRRVLVHPPEAGQGQAREGSRRPARSRAAGAGRVSQSERVGRRGAAGADQGGAQLGRASHSHHPATPPSPPPFVPLFLFHLWLAPSTKRHSFFVNLFGSHPPTLWPCLYDSLLPLVRYAALPQAWLKGRQSPSLRVLLESVDRHPPLSRSVAVRAARFHFGGMWARLRTVLRTCIARGCAEHTGRPSAASPRNCGGGSDGGRSCGQRRCGRCVCTCRDSCAIDCVSDCGPCSCCQYHHLHPLSACSVFQEKM